MSTIPVQTIRMSGSARNGKNTGIRCGFLNLQPKSFMVEFIFKNSLDTVSIGLDEMIPAI